MFFEEEDAMNVNGYDRLGQAGLELMQKSMNTAAAAAEDIASGSLNPMDVAKSAMDLSQAKVQMKLGAYLIRTQQELMESTLEVFGVGTKLNRRY